jgi:hypothetical protein
LCGFPFRRSQLRNGVDVGGWCSAQRLQELMTIGSAGTHRECLTRVQAKVQLKVKVWKVKVKAQGAQIDSSKAHRGQRQQSVVMTNESMQSLGPSMTATMRA